MVFRLPSLPKAWIIPAIFSLFSYYKIEDYMEVPNIKEAAHVKQEYDYIVVGGGSAGCVVASRLSEDPSVDVLLLEAGGQEAAAAQVPALAAYLQKTDIDWEYKSHPSSTSCLAMKDNRCSLPRGKVIGGSSSINYMLYIRGSRHDYDRWEKMGNQGWSYRDVFPYFLKFEDNTDERYASNTAYHSRDGPQPVSTPKWHTPLASAFLQAGEELGYQSLDVNGPTQTGFMIPQGYVKNGVRYSSAKSYLRVVQHRDNFDVLLNALVVKVLFDEHILRASAVRIIHDGSYRNISARREIILSAGAIGTPHLLMLSGIGPASHLKHFGIAPFVDLPVGRNLQDHIAGGLLFTIEKHFSYKQERLESYKAALQYAMLGSGPLVSLGTVEGISFLNTKYVNESMDWPDIELHFASSTHASDQGRRLRHILGLRDDVWQRHFLPLAHKDAFTIVVKLMRPISIGYIQLQSSDYSVQPKIVSNYLSNPYDLLVLVDGMKLAKRIGESEALKPFGTKYYAGDMPGCEGLLPDSDENFACLARHLTLTIYHYSGTAKMGPYWDKEAVVDPQLRVYGVSGLRVADASIFPKIPTGNINAAVLMTAEKAADMVKYYWAQSYQQNDFNKALSIPFASPSATEISSTSTLATATDHITTMRKFHASFRKNINPSTVSTMTKPNSKTWVVSPTSGATSAATTLPTTVAQIKNIAANSTKTNEVEVLPTSVVLNMAYSHKQPSANQQLLMTVYQDVDNTIVSNSQNSSLQTKKIFVESSSDLMDSNGLTAVDSKNGGRFDSKTEKLFDLTNKHITTESHFRLAEGLSVVGKEPYSLAGNISGYGNKTTISRSVNPKFLHMWNVRHPAHVGEL